LVDKVVPYLINLGEVIPARATQTLLNEMAMALIDVINVYGKSINKLGKIHKISMCFWPARLIPLNENRACVCSFLLNKQEKLNVGQYNQIPPPPGNVIKGGDPASFLMSLRSYNSNYLGKGKYFKRGVVIQDALFNTGEIGYFKSFFLNQYNIGSFGESYFLLEGDPIARSVNQIKINQEIYDYVSLKDVKMLDNYAQSISNLVDNWSKKSSQEVDKIKGTKVDTSEEEKQLAVLNKELQQEKERDLQSTPEELIKSGKYKINDKTGEFMNGLNAIKSSIERIRQAIQQKNIFLLDEGIKDLDIKYTDLGNSISRYKTEITQLKKNLDREKYDIEKLQAKKISELESKIAEVQKEIDSKHANLSSDLSSAEDVMAQIKTEKQSCLNNIERVKDTELNNVQNFLNNFSIEIKTQNVVVGVPIFIFYFVDPNTKVVTERAPVLPILVDRGKVVSTKVKASFRKKIRDLMNKYNPMIDLVEAEGDKANLMQLKNLDTRLEDAINDLRMSKILTKKQGTKAIEIIHNLVW
jgi:hypothetical protein